ncbi:hypothetical protein CC78DRAFT_614396 [Lojkania enalia]|uniref:Glycosyltransferase family 25 protein n=1 Tax=Lojkania enalia TaxID=147567 RepID=A0A9P4KER0_9PLEO|nr:hypothetical protein CC78DRAFT_614396 [Didymosphaeria enalia]
MRQVAQVMQINRYACSTRSHVSEPWLPNFHGQKLACSKAPASPRIYSAAHDAVCRPRWHSVDRQVNLNRPTSFASRAQFPHTPATTLYLCENANTTRLLTATYFSPPNNPSPTMAAPRKRLIPFLGCTAVASILFLVLHNRAPLLPIRDTFPTSSTPALQAANKTLANGSSNEQFGVVLAVSHAKSPRRKDLVYATNLTGIEIVVPEQPAWTDDHVEAFRSGESKITRGSALAWMGHLNALKWFLSTPLTTALILEDDVDFSTHLPTTQVPLAAHATRLLLTPTNHSSPSTTPDYWSPPPAWEILFLGHCNDKLPATLLPSTRHLAYRDPTLVPPSHLHPSTLAQLRNLNIPPQTRVLHRSHWPLCTFAYGVTRASASRILREYGTEGPGGCEAYDVRILEACRDHGWRCYSVVPELLHHTNSGSEIAHVNDGGAEDKEEKRPGRTPNIACAARDRGLWSQDTETVAWLRREVLRGECFADWVDEDMGVLG